MDRGAIEAGDLSHDARFQRGLATQVSDIRIH
jgi:hypothetical protein